MSIRTSFNPLGTLGGANEVPFVQPVMTSGTTWSNEPSCGWTITFSGADWFSESTYPWKAFDASFTTYAATSNNASYKRYFYLTTDEPIKILGVTIRARDAGSPAHWGLERKGSDGWVEIARGYDDALNTAETVVADPVYSDEYRLWLNGLNEAGEVINAHGFITNMKVNAMIRK